jgi:hypothetical protein
MGHFVLICIITFVTVLVEKAVSRRDSSSPTSYSELRNVVISKKRGHHFAFSSVDITLKDF